MILGSAQLPIVLLDATASILELIGWWLAGLAALAFTWFVGLLVSFGVAMDVRKSARLEVLCVVLAAIHVAAGLKLRDLVEGGFDLLTLPARISLIVGPLVLSGVIIGRVRRRQRRSRAPDTSE